MNWDAFYKPTMNWNEAVIECFKREYVISTIQRGRMNPSETGNIVSPLKRRNL